MLEAIGLDDVHTAVYRIVLEVPSASIDQIALAAELSHGTVREVVDLLERRGLIARQAAAPDRVVASPPTLALRPMLLERERRLTEAHEALVELSEIYRQGAAQRETPDVVDVVLGSEAVRQRFAQLQASAARTVDALVLSDVAFIDSAENLEEERALRRGVGYRVIVETPVMERPGFVAAAREAAEFGERIRVLPSLPTRLLIADREIALLPMKSRGQDRAAGALLVHPSGLLDLVVGAFDQLWSTASELAPGATTEGVDGELLSLLLLGMTDAAAAAQLGISLRTAQRRIADLMTRTGVATRLQLGAAAVRLGWV